MFERQQEKRDKKVKQKLKMNIYMAEKVRRELKMKTITRMRMVEVNMKIRRKEPTNCL